MRKKANIVFIGGSYCLATLVAAIESLKGINSLYKEPHPGYFDNVNYQNKKQKRSGSKIPKQKQKIRRR